jgi:general secretion pathway protein H
VTIARRAAAGGGLASPSRHSRRRAAAGAGFTLIELMVVMAIVAIGVGLIALSIRDPAGTRLEHDAARLVALLETARTEARAGGFGAVWVPATEPGQEDFRFVGLPASLKLPTRWLDPAVTAQVAGGTSVNLGPDAILAPQRIVLRLDDQRIEIATDGISAFAVAPPVEGG